MTQRYNLIAGRSIERLAALSDGVFAVAMTLLVLDLKVPAARLATESALLDALGDLAPRLLVYLLSFLTLGIFWVGKGTQLSLFARGDRHVTWIHLGFLFGVSLMPFSTSLMAEFITLRSALLVYWLNILALGALLLASWRYAKAAGLATEAVPAIERRILTAQALYAVGAALCAMNTYRSIGFIIAVQIVYVIGPKRGILSRI
jgi:hypothetical protein